MRRMFLVKVFHLLYLVMSLNWHSSSLNYIWHWLINIMKEIKLKYFFLDKPMYFFSWNWLQIETLPFCSWQSEPANVSSVATLLLRKACLFIRLTNKIYSRRLGFSKARLLYKYIGRIVRMPTTLPFIHTFI